MNSARVMIVEDDKSFLQRLARAMEGRGFVVTTAESVAEGLLQVEKAAPAFAVVDMLVIIVSVSCAMSRLLTLNCPVLPSARPYPSGA